MFEIRQWVIYLSALLLAGHEQVQRLAEQHHGYAAQRGQHEHALHGGLRLVHVLLAALRRRRAREQHHVDEQDQDRGRAARLASLI